MSNLSIRFFDVILSLVGIMVLSSAFVVIYLLIIAESKGGGIYKQSRVGKNGKDFNIYKFRTMSVDSDKKGFITVGSRDPRITKVGYYLRKYKLDELPQLFNVLLGTMSLVGPRPEVRKYVDYYSNEQKKVLSVVPGITDYASIVYVNENDILGQSENPEETYINQIMPKKIEYNMAYINNRSVKEYFKIILLTIKKILT